MWSMHKIINEYLHGFKSSISKIKSRTFSVELVPNYLILFKELLGNYYKIIQKLPNCNIKFCQYLKKQTITSIKTCYCADKYIKI